MKTSTGKWIESTLGILYVVNESVQFSDDWDHWRNGFCRLLEIPEEKARKFVEEMVTVAQEQHGKLLQDLPENERVACLTEATDRILYGKQRPGGGNGGEKMHPSWGSDPISNSTADTIYAHSVSGDSARLVVGNKEHEFAWLIDAKTQKPVTADSIVYDTTYFSAGDAHYGMKHYIAQSDWRLEKSRRLVRTVLATIGPRKVKWLAKPKETRVIDIGSGIGYYRKAFDELGLAHYGIDLSTDIIVKCKEYFGFETWHCELTKLHDVCADMKFHMISMWDVIEHLEDPLSAVQFLKNFLTPDGVLVVRTPNLSASEAEILGDFYYSFKFDHVRYFSTRSLDYTMDRAGLKPVYVETSSHIFKGALGVESMYKTGQALKGADIVGVYELS